MNPLLTDPTFWAGIITVLLVIMVTFGLVFVGAWLAIHIEMDRRGVGVRNDKRHR